MAAKSVSWSETEEETRSKKKKKRKGAVTRQKESLEDDDDDDPDKIIEDVVGAIGGGGSLDLDSEADVRVRVTRKATEEDDSDNSVVDEEEEEEEDVFDDRLKPTQKFPSTASAASGARRASSRRDSRPSITRQVFLFPFEFINKIAAITKFV